MLRIAICQTVLPHYRVPVFDLLGSQPGIELTVFHGAGQGTLDNAAPSPNFTAVQVPIRTFRFSERLQFRVQQAQHQVMDPSRFDLVILSWDLHFIDQSLATLRGRARRLPVALWGHGYSKKPGAVRTFLRNRAGQLADAVLLYSQSVAELMVHRYRFDPARVFVAQNAIDQRPVQAARQHWLDRPEALRQFQAEHHLDPSQTLLFVSRLEPDNHVEWLIDGLALLRRQRPEARLVIIGNGRRRGALETYARVTGQQEHVQFVGPLYEEAAIAPWMLSATLMAYPINIGLSAMHAFGYGLPVVTSDQRWAHNPEIEAVEPERTGLLFPGQNIEGMVAQWERLIANPALREKLSTQARQLVLTRYTLENMVQGFLDLTRIVDGKQRTVQAPAAKEDTAVASSPAIPAVHVAGPARKRVLWLHTQPEHYFNRMIDDLNRVGDLEYIAAFLRRGPGLYTEVPVPQYARSLFLRPVPGREKDERISLGRLHLDWRLDLYPLGYQGAVVSGYAGQTQREILRDCRRRGVPALLFSDSNLRSQRGRTLRERAKRSLKRQFLRPIVHDVNGLITANRLGVAYWRYFGAAAEKIHVAPYYADYQRIDEARRTDRTAVLTPFGLDPARRIIVSAARLVPVKRLDLMIDAFAASGLAERGWIYAIAGTGELEAELKARCGNLLNRSIRFLGFVQPRELLALIRHAELFVLPSDYEPHGIVVQEAMAAGTPVITSDVCGAGYDLVVPGQSGWFFRSGRVESLQAALAQATQSDDTLPNLRASTRGVFDDWFARTNPVQVVDRLMHQLLADASRSSSA